MNFKNCSSFSSSMSGDEESAASMRYATHPTMSPDSDHFKELVQETICSVRLEHVRKNNEHTEKYATVIRSSENSGSDDESESRGWSEGSPTGGQVGQEEWTAFNQRGQNHF